MDVWSDGGYLKSRCPVRGEMKLLQEGERGIFNFLQVGGSGSSLEQPNKIEVSPYDKLLAMHDTG